MRQRGSWELPGSQLGTQLAWKVVERLLAMLMVLGSSPRRAAAYFDQEGLYFLVATPAQYSSLVVVKSSLRGDKKYGRDVLSG